MDSYRPRGSGEYRTRPGPDRPDPYSYGSGDSYRPPRRDEPFRPPPREDESNGMYYFRGSRDEESRRREPYRPRQREQHRRDPPGRGHYFQRPKVAERPLLRLEHRQEDSSLIDPNADLKFRNVEELTDSEEEAMAVSDNDEPSRSTKRARLQGDDPTPESANPRWSNPDPYTALPPPSEAAAKRTDVVKLIRKARIDANLRAEAASDQADFISFDMNDTEPTVPESLPTAIPAMGIMFPQPNVPTQPSTVPIQPPNGAEDGILGKRKRGDAKGTHTTKLHTTRLYYGDRLVREEWSKPAGTSSSPWKTTESSVDLAGVALHKEIIDFYDWVRPKEYEQAVREEVFQRLRQEFRRCGPSGDLYAFGSYAAGLYLPTGDMDIVYITSRMRPGSLPSREAARPLVRRFHDFLRTQRIAKHGSILAIAHAKVPLLKFVDKISGLKIDLSFDNDTGIAAIETFHRWKSAYPAMPIIVSIVKQYLMMRGLNDVSTGGLGGFSTICLVTSLLQHLPVTTEPLNLGEVLLEFFNLYGNVFNRREIAIRMEPPAYLDKSTYMPHLLKKDKGDSRLTIIDPNRPDNNISGGTSQINEIGRSFSSAYQALVERLDMYEEQFPHNSTISFLECLSQASSTTEYIDVAPIQSNNCQAKHACILIGRNKSPPPAEASARDSIGTLTVPSTSFHWINVSQAKNQESNSTNQQGTSIRNKENVSNDEAGKDESKPPKNERRALRFKRLRPELASSVGRALSILQAMTLGGYGSKDAMHKDLATRELALNSKKK
ncbi:hypothetical protein H2204_005506 [Knufia peltigerae]|uniref:polynucleotide adenylyltransferase n=1 Tax=Knufia peltigerae TaxID=1002370 RepID=A0AA38Y575_9EURO|nr:hypothetical protein H2204_005506 [Knufia peltigerae]